ncbi:phospholipase [Staphylococcus aureus]|nr:phospholipase [Staphylococcus aureus]MDH2957184.1 phospholipase [Staphylococcus aureus]
MHLFCCKLYKRSDNDGEKTKSNTLKKDATLALANLLLIGALTDNSAKAESKKDDTDLKLVSHNVYMLSTVLYPNWRLLT